MGKKKKKKRLRTRFQNYVLNCVPSVSRDEDWTFADAVDAGVVEIEAAPEPVVDLRRDWWPVEDQGKTGACVGYAAAYGVLRWHFVEAGILFPDEKPSARFIWMANKETDDITSYPTAFLEVEGTQTKYALKVIRNYGCVLDEDLPMEGGLSKLSRAKFFTKAARLRIASYHNLGQDFSAWRRWLASQGPILTRLEVDKTWDRASETGGFLKKYKPYKNKKRGGHAFCLVGYNDHAGHFIVRNSWGEVWGDKGFGYAEYGYAAEAFTEAYGAVL